MNLLRYPLVAIALLALAMPTVAQSWSSLNPGAGGQIQDVLLDPTLEDRAYVLSDVEGMYRTTNGGQTYTPVLNGLTTVDVLTGAIDPRSGKVYIGTDLGLHTSAAGGGFWTRNGTINPDAQPGLITKTERGNPGSPNAGQVLAQKLHVGSIVLLPGNSDYVAVGIGDKRFSETKKATVFWSIDAGASFEVKEITELASGNANILQLAAGGGLLYAAAQDAGLWVSGTWGYSWVRIPSPVGGPATGVAVSPDGQAVYATFGAGERIFAATSTYSENSVTTGPWQTLTVNNGLTYDNQGDNPIPDFRNLQIDPESTWPVHRILTATGRGFPRDGLAEVTVTWTGNSPSGSWQSIFDYGAPRYNEAPAPNFVTGWEGNDPNPYAYAYAPPSWSGRQIWSTTDQTLFKIDTQTSSYTQGWTQIYTDEVSTVNGIKTWHDRGWVSTVDFDADQYGDAVCSSKGDHGVVMSWDGGDSWEVESTQQFLAPDQFGQVIVGRSNSCRLVRTTSGTLYVVAHLTTGYGAGAVNGQLWGSKLNSANPEPADWVFLAGGNGGANRTPANLPDKRIDYIEQNPHDRDQLFLAVRDEGVYAIDDLDALYNARDNNGSVPNLYRLGGANAPSSPTEKDNTVRMDPNDPNAIFVANGFEVLRGTRNGSSWTWTSVCGSGDVMKMDVWDRDGETILACRVYSAVDDEYLVRVSTDDGGWGGNLSWFNQTSLTNLRTPTMVPDEEQQEIWNLAGTADKLYVNVQQNTGGLVGYGIFEITVAADGSLSNFQDVTGGVTQPRSIRMRTVEENGNRWLFVASWGAGTWRRPVVTSVTGGPGPNPDPPGPPTGVPTEGPRYTIRNALSTSRVLTAEAPDNRAWIQPSSGALDQQWQLYSEAGGPLRFWIWNRDPSRGFLHSPNGDSKWSSNVGFEGTWDLVADGTTGAYYIRNAVSGRYLTSNGDGGTWTDASPSPKARWLFESLDAAVPPSTALENGAPSASAALVAPPDVLTLASAGPNPTRGALRVQFGVPVTSDLSVVVYDVQGRRVVEQVRSVSPGWHLARVSTAALSPGVYVVRLTAGAETVTQTFTVVR